MDHDDDFTQKQAELRLQHFKAYLWARPQWRKWLLPATGSSSPPACQAITPSAETFYRDGIILT